MDNAHKSHLSGQEGDSDAWSGSSNNHVTISNNNHSMNRHGSMKMVGKAFDGQIYDIVYFNMPNLDEVC